MSSPSDLGQSAPASAGSLELYHIVSQSVHHHRKLQTPNGPRSAGPGSEITLYKIGGANVHIRSQRQEIPLVPNLRRQTLQIRAHQIHVRDDGPGVVGLLVVQASAAEIEDAFAERERVADS